MFGMARHFGHGEVPPSVARRDDGGLPVLADGGRESLRRAGAPDGDLHLATRRGFAHQALKLRGALHRLAVEFEHDVAFLDAGFGRRTVLGQAGDLHAALFLQVESLGAFGADVQPADAEIAAIRLLHFIRLRDATARYYNLRECGGRDKARRRSKYNSQSFHGNTPYCCLLIKMVPTVAEI